MTKPAKPVEIWDSPFEHWHVLGPILWGVVAYIGAVVAHELQAPVQYVVLPGLVVSGLAPLVSIHKRFSAFLMLATTALLTWTTITTPLARDPALVALLGSVLFGMIYHALRNRETKEADTDKLATKAAEKGRYVDLLETIGLKGLKEARRIPFAAGKTIVLLLPVNGSITLTRLKDSTEALEIAAARAGLRVTFEFERGEMAAEILLHVFDRDILAEDIPLPFDRGPKSICEPIPLGQFPTGEVCVITFREVAALMVGLKGKGKSGLINTHLAYLTGCTDAVVWLLDGKSGETVRPWLQPFLDQVTDKPVINWAATTEAEFDAVLLAANAVRKFRTSRAPRSPSPGTPAVIVIVEEASVITGVSRYGGANRVQLAQDGVTLGRSSCLDWLFATQRATLDMLGSGSMKANLDLRYGLGVTEQADARMIFPDASMAKTLFRLGSELKYRGTFLMQSPNTTRVMPVKGYWVDPSTIPGIAETNAAWVAELDQETADYVHQALLDASVPGGYYGRWDRYLGRRPVDTPRATRPEPPSQPGTGPAVSAVQDVLKASRAKRDDETFQALMETAGFTEGGTKADWTGSAKIPSGIPPILGSVMAVMQGRGESKLPSRVIAEELNITPKTLGRFMGLCNVSPVENLMWDGKRARGYTWDDVETSVKRGSWTLGAFDWQP